MGVQLGGEYRTVVMVMTTVSREPQQLTVGPSSTAIVYTCGLENILLNLWL